jgi:hypothetical protein
MERGDEPRHRTMTLTTTGVLVPVLFLAGLIGWLALEARARLAWRVLGGGACICLAAAVALTIASLRSAVLSHYHASILTRVQYHLSRSETDEARELTAHYLSLLGERGDAGTAASATYGLLTRRAWERECQDRQRVP